MVPEYLHIQRDETTTTRASPLFLCPLLRCLAALLMLLPMASLAFLAAVTNVLAPAAKFEILALGQLVLRVSTTLAACSVEVIRSAVVLVMGKTDFELLLGRTTEVAIEYRK